MNCEHCGFELEEGMGTCPNCGCAYEPVQNGWDDRADRINQSDRIEVLPPDERANFQGLTIVQEPEEEKHGESFYEYQSQSPRGRVYVRHFSLGNAPGGTFGKIIGGAVLLGLVIVALPLALLVLGIFLAWRLLAWRRRR